MKSALMTPALASEAMRLLTPTIEGIIKLDPARNAIYIVIAPYDAGGEYAPIWRGAIGEQDQAKWARPYNEYAYQKALVTLRTGLPSHLVQRDYAHLYAINDFKYGGSENRKGIIVAASGLAWHHDYAVSAMAAGMIDGLVKGAFDAELLRKPFFVGETEKPEA